MIAFLRGRVLEKHPNRVIVDVGGVGYDLAVPLSTFYTAGEAGAEITLRVHTHVREDQLALFGFATRARARGLRAADRDQRHRAEAGARGAVGHRAARAGRRAIQRGDVARLTRIPGVGKKTAERIVIELRDRLPKAVEAAGAGAAGAEPDDDALRDDLASALGQPRLPSTRPIDKVLDKLPRRRWRTPRPTTGSRTCFCARP